MGIMAATENSAGERLWPSNVAQRLLSTDSLSAPGSPNNNDTSEYDKRITRRFQNVELNNLNTVATLGMSKVPGFAFVLHPNSNFRSMLDFFSLCILAYDLTLTPLILAWDIEVDGVLYIMSVVIAVWWTLDIFFNFRTGFFANGVLEMHSRAVARRYLRWFPIDAAITMVDWSGIIISVTMTEESSSLTSLSTYPRIVKATKVLRLLNLLRVGRFVEPLERLGDQFVSKVLHQVSNMVLIFSVLFLVNHVLACAWYALTMSPTTDTGHRWTDIPLMSNAESYGDFGFSFQYLTAFHWTLTQMTPGSMPVQPTNSQERVFNIVCLFLGLLFFSSVISSMTTGFTQLKMLALERERKINELESFLRQKSISREMAVAVKKQVLRRMSQRKPLEMGDITVLPMLSLTLREELMFDLCKQNLRGHELFRLVEQTDTTVLRNISTKAVSFKALLPQDVLFVADIMCDDAYLVSAGSIDYTEQFSSLSLITRVGVSAEDSFVVQQNEWLCWAALWSHWIHVGKAEARSVSEVMVLNSDAVSGCIARSAELRAFFFSYSATFHKRLVAASPGSAGMWPNDVRVPLTDYGEIVLGMEPREQKFVGSKALEKMEGQHHFMWTGLSPQSAHELEREVLSGKSVLVENSDGQAERVVALTVLRVRRDDGQILVVLAKRRLEGAEGFQPDGQLPGVKQEGGELPSQAVRRMLLGQMRPYAKELRIHSFKLENLKELSARFNITTKYIRAIFSAKLPDGFSRGTRVSGLAFHNTGSALFGSEERKGFFHHRTFAPELHECHILKDVRGEYLCCFMPPEVVDWMRRASGRKQLANWVANLPPTL